jgi:hypothetical protein
MDVPGYQVAYYRHVGGANAGDNVVRARDYVYGIDSFQTLQRAGHIPGLTDGSFHQ